MELSAGGCTEERLLPGQTSVSQEPSDMGWERGGPTCPSLTVPSTLAFHTPSPTLSWPHVWWAEGGEAFVNKQLEFCSQLNPVFTSFPGVGEGPPCTLCSSPWFSLRGAGHCPDPSGCPWIPHSSLETFPLWTCFLTCELRVEILVPLSQAWVVGLVTTF